MTMMIIIIAVYNVYMLRKLATQVATRRLVYVFLEEFNTKKMITS